MIEMSEYDRLNEGATPRPWEFVPEGNGEPHDEIRGADGDMAVDLDASYGEYAGLTPTENIAFIVALANAADDIKRLWEATECRTPDECPACASDWMINGGIGHNHAPDCPHEALRPLFGDDRHD